MSKTVTRAMLCETAVGKTSFDRHDVSAVCEDMFRLMRDALVAGENVKMTGFGSLQVRSRAERVGRNPRTGTEHVISSRRTVVLTPSAQLRQALDAKS